MDKKFKIYRLEDRILFEAAGAGDIIEAVESQPDNTDIAEPENHDGIPDIPDIDSEIAQMLDGEIPPGYGDIFDFDFNNPFIEQAEESQEVDYLEINISSGRELVIINSSVRDAEAIINTLRPDQDFLRIEHDRDAMADIQDFLAGSNIEYDAIHIITHGNSGYFVLNGEVIDSENFMADDWQELGRHLAPHGDILLYGCKLAESESGRELISMIADASGADVAAGSNMIGFGGEWNLDYRHGLIETETISILDYGYKFEGYLVTVESDYGIYGDLRYGVTHPSSGEEIFFHHSVNSISLSSEIEITRDIVVNGGCANKVFIDGGGMCRLFNVTRNAEAEFHNLAFQNGYAEQGAAIYAESGTTVKVYNSLFIDNFATDNGGAIATEGNLNIDHSLFNNNLAGKDGGAIYFTGDNNLTIKNSSFTDNHATGNGGTFNARPENGQIHLNNSLFTGNYSGNEGGALYVRLENDNSILTVNNSHIHNNYAAKCNRISFDGGSPTTVNTIVGFHEQNLPQRDIYTLPYAVQASYVTESDDGLIGDDIAIVKIFGDEWNISTDGRGTYYLAKYGDAGPLDDSNAGIYPVAGTKTPMFFMGENKNGLVETNNNLIFTDTSAEVSVSFKNPVSELILLIPVVGIDPPTMKGEEKQAI